MLVTEGGFRRWRRGSIGWRRRHRREAPGWEEGQAGGGVAQLAATVIRDHSAGHVDRRRAAWVALRHRAMTLRRCGVVDGLAVYFHHGAICMVCPTRSLSVSTPTLSVRPWPCANLAFHSSTREVPAHPSIKSGASTVIALW
jgi:hypothetical protein